ncbi:hypothetical protein ACWD5V_40935, partial [Streptomyces sp. NPDC002523]
SFVLATWALLLLRPRLNESSSMPDSTYFDREGSEQLTLLVGEFMAVYHPTMNHHPMIFEDGP